MAIEIFSEISSPRISFSHDLNQSDHQDHNNQYKKSESESDFDFDFCFLNNNNSFSVHQELSSADELFSNGKILPENQINKKKPQKQFSIEPNTPKKRLKELLSIDFDPEPNQKPPKSFWQFKRSSSFNHESTTRSKGLIRSLLLSRSNSTGSTPNPPLKETRKQSNFQRQESKKYYNYNNNSSSQRIPPLKKCGSCNNNGGFRINPVLNLPPPYISVAAASFFGLGSLFCYNKNKKKKR